MPGITIPYTDEPLVMLELRVGNVRADVLGVVDSGAGRTLLPKALAATLGIRNEQLVPIPGGGQAAGGLTIPVWRTTQRITAQVHVEPGPAGLWGPEIVLQPTFADDAPTLFGRADFFLPFVVRFVRDPQHGDLVHLDYSAAE